MENGRRGEDRRSRSTALHASIFIPLINSILVVHRSFIPTSVSLYLTLPRRPSLSRLSLFLPRTHVHSSPLCPSRCPVYFPLPLLPVSLANVPLSLFLSLSRSPLSAHGTSCPFSTFSRPSHAVSVLLALVHSVAQLATSLPLTRTPPPTTHIRTTDTNSVTTKSAWLRASRVNPQVSFSIITRVVPFTYE